MLGHVGQLGRLVMPNNLISLNILFLRSFYNSLKMKMLLSWKRFMLILTLFCCCVHTLLMVLKYLRYETTVSLSMKKPVSGFSIPAITVCTTYSRHEDLCNNKQRKLYDDLKVIMNETEMLMSEGKRRNLTSVHYLRWRHSVRQKEYHLRGKISQLKIKIGEISYNECPLF